MLRVACCASRCVSQAMADSRCCSPDSEADDVPRCADGNDGTGCSNSESEAAVGPNAASVIDALDGCLIRLRLALERAQAHSLPKAPDFF